MELTDEQSSAIDNALDNLSSEDRYAAIVGSAGTGKSFTAARLLEKAPSYAKITYLAPTNKAVQNIEQMIQRMGLDAECKTIHKFLSLSKEVIDPKTGKRTFKRGNQFDEDPVDPVDHLLVIDEIGKVPNNIDDQLALSLMSLDNPILGLGDECQTPPPKEEIGSLFSLMKDRTSYLQTVMRYGGCLLDIATNIRHKIRRPDALSVLENSLNDGNDGLYRLAPMFFDRTVEQYVKSDEFRNDPNWFRVLTWRKEPMNYWNSKIRKVIYGSEADSCLYLPGERVIALESCVNKRLERSTHRTYWKTDRLLTASQEASIIESTPGVTECLGTDFNVLYLDVITDLNVCVQLRYLLPDSEAKYNTILIKLKNDKKWKDYWKLKDHFHDVRHAYSLNIDRCQGITLSNIAIDMGDVKGCRDIWLRNRVAYTMLTRAKSRVYV